ncbi:thermostable direct hemolysin-family toxin [Aliivibrio sp. S10_S31]|uniref:thermostable direct hemolysin-family toxin n=1 Tax=Aliivibrio sp. S10_S31 TaxID=2720224 RepID=UPI0016804AF4|nr:thermostable direct hemolysin-family toxin [Aliivibrio sp. S10_S31]MBD1571498.1 thermostable direct hemolysin-family toxin [Aliivibrio sp. S10_S31]
MFLKTTWVILFFLIPFLTTASIDVPIDNLIPQESGVIKFIVKNKSTELDVNVDSYWSNKTIKRVPNSDVKKQSIFTISNTPWAYGYLTISIDNRQFTMAAISGYENFSSMIKVRFNEGTVTNSSDSVIDFIGVGSSFPYIGSVVDLPLPNYFVNTELYEENEEILLVMCISDSSTYDECKYQD